MEALDIVSKMFTDISILSENLAKNYLKPLLNFGQL